MLRIHAEDVIDPRTQSHLAYLLGAKGTTGMHDHDFYEVFVVTQGGIVHIVNGSRIALEKGSLVLMRPADSHCYEALGDVECSFANLAFMSSVMQELLDFLGAGFQPGKLLGEPLPPMVQLSDLELEAVTREFDILATIPRERHELIRTQTRALIASVLIRHFRVRDRYPAEDIPEWLMQLRHDMQRVRNFTAGLDTLYELSGRSPEHVSRMIKKHFGMTPTHWINQLRLHYAASLLVGSDAAVLDVALQCGFDNASHFHHLFRAQFHCSPREYRRNHAKSIVF